MKINKIARYLALAAAVCVTLTLAACQKDSEIGDEPEYSDIVLADTITSEDDSVIIEGSVATITESGYYRVTGTLENGRLVVNVPKKSGDVNILLDGMSVSCSDASPFCSLSADNLRLILGDGTVNTITDTRPAGTYDDDAALYSKDDLFISAQSSETGRLTVAGNCQGICGKDDVRISGGIITVTSGDHSIKGKDSLTISGGTISVDSEADGLKSTNDKDASKGYLEISGGTITINALDDGIYAVSRVTISGGKIDIKTENNGIKCDNTVDIRNAAVAISTQDDGILGTALTGDGSATVTVNGQPLEIGE